MFYLGLWCNIGIYITIGSSFNLYVIITCLGSVSLVAGKMKGIAFIKDPDGYWTEIFDLKTIGKVTETAAWNHVSHYSFYCCCWFILICLPSSLDWQRNQIFTVTVQDAKLCSYILTDSHLYLDIRSGKDIFIVSKQVPVQACITSDLFWLVKTRVCAG